MEPKNLKINGTTIPDIESVTYALEERSTGNGFPGGNQRAMQIAIRRKAAPERGVQGFELCANSDGTVMYADGQIEFQDTMGTTTYALDFEHAFVEHWSLSCDDGEVPIESLSLRTPKATMSVGSDSAGLLQKDGMKKWPKA